jgi:hypothetical protein
MLIKLNFLLYVSISFTIGNVVADTPVKLAGDVEFTDISNTKKGDSYEVTQEKVITVFKNHHEALSSGRIPEPIILTEQQSSYLAGVYLVCVLKKGTCPEILDALLESEVIRVASTKDGQCPTMKQFWKTWIGEKFEQKHGQYNKMSFFNVRGEFNKNERPKYVKCSATAKERASKIKTPDSYIKSKYAGKNSNPSLLALTTLTGISKSVSNVFSEEAYQ